MRGSDECGAHLGEREVGILVKDSPNATTKSNCDPSLPTPPGTSSQVRRATRRKWRI
ncbi:hypothetical protein PISMIDRAFT_690257 [Pisolithus microcarpus 441]|uniref:Uncharacterized protein n=1 Tax=Pisolithus microcarpus 441 TaxID=765257 RepID=A0A0C9YCF7_9AGAM|nr:hypothetical protein PISMIDRAFT_690257 [Pisolithus microcarpus 441]